MCTAALVLLAASAEVHHAAASDEHPAPAVLEPDARASANALIAAWDRAHPPAPLPERPSECVVVPAGGALASSVGQGAEGTAFCLDPGVHHGPVGVPSGVVVWGPHEAVVLSSGEGTTVRIEGAGSSWLGTTVDGSGGRFDTLDAAIRIAGEDHTVRGAHVRNAMFGILVETATRAQIADNTVTGFPDVALGLRGDGIRLWETRGSLIRDNRVFDSRDVVVWYSSDNRIEGNLVTGSRYGTHFMYSHDNRVVGNGYLANVVGTFVMYSRGITLLDNVVFGSGGAAGIGIGLKDSGNVRMEGSVLVRNATGLYIDTSPLYKADTNRFERNLFRMCEAAVIFHSSPHRNEFVSNSFRDNLAVVRVEGGGDALSSTFLRNDFDDYAGYDIDKDGFGDIPYEARTLSGQLVDRTPNLAFLRGSFALFAIDVAAKVLPLAQPRLLLVDPEPRMGKLAVDGDWMRGFGSGNAEERGGADAD
jgi:nitrous oxidase accessory protein